MSCREAAPGALSPPWPALAPVTPPAGRGGGVRREGGGAASGVVREGCGVGRGGGAAGVGRGGRRSAGQRVGAAHKPRCAAPPLLRHAFEKREETGID